MSAAQFEREVSSQQEEAEYAERIKNKWPCVALWPGKEKTMSAELLKVNVNDHTEKKNNLTYLSWAWAWAEVLKFDSAAIWAVHTYGPQGGEEPYMRVGKTAMVHVSVTIKGLRRECMLPVMDHRNKAIPDPDAFQVNTAIMRCMTKAISMHGLGLYIYAGEDLPEGEERPTAPPTAIAKSFRSSPTMGEMEALSVDEQTYIRDLGEEVKADNPDGAVRRIEAENLDDSQKMALWSILDSKTRAAIKKTQATMKETV
jgi:hypothetical protein